MFCHASSGRGRCMTRSYALIAALDRGPKFETPKFLYDTSRCFCDVDYVCCVDSPVFALRKWRPAVLSDREGLGLGCNPMLESRRAPCVQLVYVLRE